jgi:hypothetical protein
MALCTVTQYVLPQLLPASVRSWYTMLKNQKTASGLQIYTMKRESPALLQQEMQAMQSMRQNDMAITASSGGREVIAAIEVDEGVSLELAFSMPACYPLQPAEVCCTTNERQELCPRLYLLLEC